MYHRGSQVYELLRQVRPIVLGSARAVEDGVRELGWTVGSRAVVEVLAEEGPATVPQIAARLSLARQNVQRHVDELSRLSHARTRPNPAHQRSVLVELTDAGRQAFVGVRTRELEALDPMCADCTDDELAAASKVLAAMDRDIRARHPPTRKGAS